MKTPLALIQTGNAVAGENALLQSISKRAHLYPRVVIRDLASRVAVQHIHLDLGAFDPIIPSIIHSFNNMDFGEIYPLAGVLEHRELVGPLTIELAPKTPVIIGPTLIR
jgi:hypothetical protein